jgi:hypothetical protein
MAVILKEQGFQKSGCTSTECAVEIGRLLNVQKIVAGRVGKIGPVYSVSIRLIDVESGEILKTAIRDCRCPLEDVLTRVIREAVDELGEGPGTPQPPAPVVVAPPRPAVTKAVVKSARERAKENKCKTSLGVKAGFSVGTMADRTDGGVGLDYRVTGDITPELTVGIYTGIYGGGDYEYDGYDNHRLTLFPIEAVVLYNLDRKGIPGMYVGAQIGVNYYKHSPYEIHGDHGGSGFAFSFAPLVSYYYVFNNGFLVIGDVSYQYAGKFLGIHNQYIGVRLGYGRAF